MKLHSAGEQDSWCGLDLITFARKLQRKAPLKRSFAKNRSNIVDIISTSAEYRLLHYTCYETDDNEEARQWGKRLLTIRHEDI